jgi:aromatic-L-amino-acid/L-tryptophan decarboxylase
MTAQRPSLPPDSEDIPPTRIGLAKLTKLAYGGADLKPLWKSLLDDVTKDPRNAAAAMDLSVVVQLLGDRESGLALQSVALKSQRLYRLPCAAAAPRLRVLALAAEVDMGGNTPIEFLLQDSDIELYTLYIGARLPFPDPLPEHDIAFVAVPESEETREVLAEISQRIPTWPRPILNMPKAIAELNRDRLYGLLKSIPGLYIPMTTRVSRARLGEIGQGKAQLRQSLEDGVFPLIARPLDSHAGRGLVKLDTPSDIGEYLKQRPEDEFFISRYVDYRDADGLFRKYRVVVIDGRPYACHMALTDEWKIWYLNADMAESAAKRAEEERFMTTFDEAFAKRHAGALAELSERVGLEYFAIDCAETSDGELLVFEGHNAMIVHDMDPPEIFPYKLPQMRKIFDAFAAMLYAHAQRPARSAEAAEPDPGSSPEVTLDPADWSDVRAQGHRMLDDMFDYLEYIRARPTWQPMPDSVRAHFHEALPRAPESLAAIHEEFTQFILPYATGNPHPGFMGWVHGGGTAVGMLAEMLAAGLNANLGGRDHAPIEVERQITEWTRQIFGFPESASGLFVTGTSMANLIGVLVARTAALGTDVRHAGLKDAGTRLRAYTSAAAHLCIAQAMDLSGLGVDALRQIPTDRHQRIDIAALRDAITADRKAGLQPFLVVGSAGTVDIGAIDDLAALRDICRDETLWFHVDGAYGALAMLSPALAPRLAGIETADSIAFDFHKWGQVPYDAGFILVRDGERHRETFASPAAYLRRETRGLAAGSAWPCDYGPDLSRGFRALKTWFTLKAFGTQQLGAVIARSCALARYLERRVLAEPELELVASAQLNIVCFRYRAEDADAVNAKVVVDVQESGIAAPSTTIIDGRLAIRAALFNHRTQQRDVDALVDAVLDFGRAIAPAMDTRVEIKRDRA